MNGGNKMNENMEHTCETCEHEHDSGNEFCGSCDNCTDSWTEAGWHIKDRMFDERMKLQTGYEKLKDAVLSYIAAKTMLTTCMQQRFKQVCNGCSKYYICKVYEAYCFAWQNLQRAVKENQ